MGTAIKHPVQNRVKPVICNFWHPVTLMLSPVCQSVQMSKITNDCLTRSGTGCFTAVPNYLYGNSGCFQCNASLLWLLCWFVSFWCIIYAFCFDFCSFLLLHPPCFERKHFYCTDEMQCLSRIPFSVSFSRFFFLYPWHISPARPRHRSYAGVRSFCFRFF